METLSGKKILVVVCGGIAAYKVADVVRRLLKRGADVNVIMTKSATRFVHPTTFTAITGHPVAVKMFDDEAASDVDHLRLPHSADLLLVAPATGNFLAKMASGIADDLASTSLLAAKCPVLVAPAMNSSMWEHQATRENMEILRSRGIEFIGPEQGEMAAPDEDPGWGRMSEPEKIETYIASHHSLNPPLLSKKVVITAGRTEEAIDDVRILTNRSSGRMGVALAEVFRDAGADVVFIHGPLEVSPPGGVRLVRITSARDMLAACEIEIVEADIVFYAAAVADWRPKESSPGKPAKEDGAEPVLELVPNPDIARLSSDLGDGFKIGFALQEGEDIVKAGQKLRNKGFDAIVLNDLQAMGAETNRVAWIRADSAPEWSNLLPKKSIANWLLERVILSI